ncbi:MAG: T9SS type A sorting domain-containing protein [Bacteroidia bacterium]|nr:T9SS type A sorting domain-containing protein [Bacteroidia bacterium]MBP9179436.1 T9SS type A sorting domain-containing protein [Bacteroidia bacterium]MBP9723715.1 T9SS type A sorting domain-containing protein [Bacteroidia bacterium]
MKQKRLTLVVALLCLWLSKSTQAQTQFSCGFDEQRQQWLDADTANYFTMHNYWQRIDKFKNNNYLQAPLDAGPQNSGSSMGVGCARANFVIPIVFHVVYDPGVSASNVHDSLVQNQLDILNKAFSGYYGGINTGIQFCLALKKPDGSSFSGINHIADSNPDYRKYGLQRNHLASKAYYDHNRYLNVWIVADIREANNTASLTGGYANIGYTTSIDGVIMRYEAAGNYNYCNSCGFVPSARGFTLIHEVGHWLGLYHTFQGESCLGDDSLTCANGGDHCCDTRAHYNPVNYTTCPPDTQKVCTSANAFYGNTPDPVHNYMNYVPEMCYTNFTADQMAIMYAGLMLTRDRISTPENLLAANLSCCLTTAVFNTTTPFKCTSDTIFTARAYPYSSVRHLWRVYRNGSLVQSHSDTTAIFTYHAPDTGTYDVSHAIVYNSNTDTTSFMRVNGFWELAHCGTNLQSTQANWVFGDHAALRFTSQGVYRNSAVYNNWPNFTSEFDASNSLSNENGSLLFYGLQDYWNKNYVKMSNSGIAYSGTPYQGLISFPVPFKKHRYYVLTVSGIEDLRPASPQRGFFNYSTIDTTLNSNGDLVSSLKNKGIEAPATGSEKSGPDSSIVPLEAITAIPKCDGENYWVITVDASGLEQNFGQMPGCSPVFCNVASYPNQLKLLVYSADSVGLTHHATSDSAIAIEDAYAALLKTSHDGIRVAMGRRVFSFDRSSGTLSLSNLLNIPSSYSIKGGSFSPNGLIYYLIVQEPSNSYFLYQFDLQSQWIINPFKIPIYSGALTFMQLGPDGKIYLSNKYSIQLPVINYPDSLCNNALPNACGFTFAGPKLANDNGSGGSCMEALPNMVDAKKKEDIPLVIYHRDTACFTVHFSSSVCCASSFSWDFGDTNTSLERNPLHTYSAKGTYTIRLIADLDTIYIDVKIGLESFTINGADTICGTPNYASYAVSLFNPYREYEWTMYKGSGTANNNGNDIDISWDSTGWVKVKANDYRTGCLDSAIKNVVVLPAITNTISSPQQICIGGTPSQINGSTPTGGVGSPYTFRWYSSTDTLNDLAWTLISGATSQNYQPASPSQPTFFKRVVVSGSCEIESNISSIVFIWNNIITADTSDCDDIIGSTPNSINSFTYTWQRSIDSSNWTNIPSQTSKDLTGPVYFKKTHVRRVVQDSLCTSYSNVLTIQPSITSPITTTTDSFCYGEALLVTGSTPCSDNSSITYQWQYKTSPSGGFSNIPVYYDSDNASLDEDWHFECELRRVSVSAGDTMLSDTLAVYFKRLDNYILSFEGFEPYRYAICSGSSAPGLVGSTICEYGAWGFAWESTTDTTDANSWQYEAGTPSFGPTVNTITKYYRRKAKHIALSDSTYTPAFQVYVRNPQIVTQPGNATLNEGTNTSFHTVCLDLEPVKWQYGKVVGGSMVWTDLTAGGLTIPDPFVPYQYTFDLLMPAELCLDGASFRAVYQNPCESPGTYTYSNTVTLTVNAVSYDVWAKDYSTDVGGEPSTVSNTFIWDSPDIWNSRSTGITYHQNPEYRISDPNYIHAIVRNKGAATSIPAKLYLYWTFASTGERWDRHWLNDTTLSSTYGNWRTYYGAKKPLGGLIGVYNVPTITSGNSWQMEAAWYAPDPGVLTGDSNATSAELCFLARIVTCSTPEYGLTYPETFYMRDNVERNNNLVTKNFIVVDSLAGNGKTHWNGNGNPTDLSATGRLVFTARDCDYFDYGTVTVHLDNELQTLWVGNGANGSGFSLINDSTLQMDSCVMTLDDIAYGAETRSLYGIQFNERDDLVILENVEEYYEFDVQQYLTEESEENSIGGILYGVPVVLYPPEISGSQRRNTPVQDTKANQLAFSAFPNPFNDVLKVVYSLPKDENVTITLTNLLGQTIQTVEQNEFKTAGLHRLDINTVNLTEGIYFITFKAGNEIKQKKIVLIR